VVARPASGIDFIRYAHNEKLGNPNNEKSFEASNPKGLNRISKIGYGHLYLMEENLRLRSPIPERGNP
jgi:hypothetical protein